MSDSDIRALALFFYFALLDDRKAIELAISAVGVCAEKKKRYPNMKSSVAIVTATAKIWDEMYLKIQRGLPNTSVESGWVLAPGLDMGPWREFQKNATHDELVCVIWSRILNFSDQDIADGLELTTGTVRYRLARAFRKLGGMTHQNLKTSMKESSNGRRN
jgi:DNA-binding CsgD family transcriptional regulator